MTATNMHTEEADHRTTRRGALRVGAAVAVGPAAAPLAAGGTDVRRQGAAPAPVRASATSLLHLEEQLRQRVVGQAAAVAAVAGAIRRSPPDVADRRRPIGSFLFLGPTGVGKTMLARALAEFLFGDEDALLRLDLSEYQKPHTVSRLSGSPLGSDGAEQRSQLSQAVRRRPSQVILFDEIEKAHAEVLDPLLQILDNGRLTDGHGRTVDFRNTVVIISSDTGTTEPALPAGLLGFGPVRRGPEPGATVTRNQMMRAPEGAVHPELPSRVDEIVVFQRLAREHLRAVLEKMLHELRTRLEARRVVLELSEGAMHWLLERGDDEVAGARPLRRLFQREIESPLAGSLRAGEFVSGDRVLVDITGHGTSARLVLAVGS